MNLSRECKDPNPDLERGNSGKPYLFQYLIKDIIYRNDVVGVIANETSMLHILSFRLVRNHS